MNYFIPYLELSGNVTQTPNPQPQVSTYIKSTQSIAPSAVVRYKAKTGFSPHQKILFRLSEAPIFMSVYMPINWRSLQPL
jgi:hypothetical protein